MKLKLNKQLLITFVVILIPLVIFVWIKQSGNFDAFYHWSQQNIYLFVSVLFIMKVAAIVYPPLPGGILTLGAIPILGVMNAYLVDLIGGMVGTSIAYALGRKYGYSFLEKIFDDSTLKRIKLIKVKPNREFETIFMLRILGSSIVELISYGAGLLKINFSSFIIGTLISHVVIGVPTFYLAKNIFSVQNILLSLSLLGLSILIMWKMKGRYFE
jgi:uncharacterized membrane protein YdjX (TVP38/TMEM64 family)